MQKRLFVIIIHFFKKINTFSQIFQEIVYLYKKFKKGGKTLDNAGKKSFIINSIFYLFLFGFIIFAAKFLLLYTFPFIIGAVIAAIVQKPAECISLKVKVKKEMLALIFSAVVYILFWIIVLLICWLVVSRSGELLPKIVSFTDKLSDEIEKVYKNFVANFPACKNGMFKDFISSSVTGIGSKIGNTVTNFVTSVAKRLPEMMISGIVTLVAGCYIAKDFDKLKKFVLNLLSEKTKVCLLKIKKIFIANIFKLVKGYLILMSIVFAELSLGFFVLRFDKPILLGFLVAFVDLLPVLGVGAVLVPLAIFMLLTGKTGTAVGVAVLYALVSLVRNFSEPKIIGDQIGIHPLFTLISMFVGLRLAGLAGLVLFPILLTVTFDYYTADE
jgi:sporulation integral membrane protein YtvI